jgi:hypothetical protein
MFTSLKILLSLMVFTGLVACQKSMVTMEMDSLINDDVNPIDPGNGDGGGGGNGVAPPLANVGGEFGSNSYQTLTSGKNYKLQGTVGSTWDNGAEKLRSPKGYILYSTLQGHLQSETVQK